MPLKKNFTYGDIWEGPILTQEDGEMEMVHPSEITDNSAFIKWIEDNGYRLYLDHSGYKSVGMFGQPGVAVTKMDRRQIILNGNYSRNILNSLLKHEMGHLLLFGCDQFTSVRSGTMRSIICREIYTGKNLEKYGVPQLLLAENIIQDIVIETFSGEGCVCSTVLPEHSHNLAVKHLHQLEDLKLITREALSNILKEENNQPYSDLPTHQLKTIEEILKSMKKELGKDRKDIEREIEENKDFEKFKNDLASSDFNKINRFIKRLDKLNDKKDAVETLQKHSPDKREELQKKIEAIEEAIRETEEEISELSSQERENAIEHEAKVRQEKKLNSLGKLLDKNENLDGEFDRALSEIAEEMESRPPEGGGSGGGESENSGGSCSDESDGGDLPQTPEEKDHSISSNETDHLSRPDNSDPSNRGHSYDCGFPHPISVSREESLKNESKLLKINTEARARKVKITNDEGLDFEGGRTKSPEKFLTYRRSSKREIDNTDMLKGKLRKNMAGVNVLIGLDISGSMTAEWGAMFNQISEFVVNLKNSLDIEKVVFFTYHSTLAEHSENIDDLKIFPSGGNAFPYVYQKIMQALPIQLRNEIILITDCGDNLGFTLDRVCEVERGFEKVKNHISVIDTEGAGFIDKSTVNTDDWTFYNYSDPNVSGKIKESIEKLIMDI